MNTIIERFDKIKSNISKINNNSSVKVVAVSKTFPLSHIMPLINYGHDHYGENKVQEADIKWKDIKKERKNLKLHLVGKLQSNKVKRAVEIFDYIHSLDSQKLADVLSKTQNEINKSINYFIQVNIGNENQKSGVNKNEINNLYIYCKKLKLHVIGLMCIPPEGEDSDKYFKEIKLLNEKLNLPELSIGMSSDYLKAVKNSSTYLRIGSSIFGKRY